MSEERYIAGRIKLAITPYRDSTGMIESFSVDHYVDNTSLMNSDQKVIYVDLALPLSLWETPVVSVVVKSKIQKLIAEIEGEEI